ncbi:hypothetical protein DSO57_1028507 [Entomophthora muscae]|uniref:Uncharacterized protein n=1 Tax=Entomophthora muscae TaxID=34485 RepID=A0ACC2TPA2_9FUNG|nr:hypothetical protein DSO57_1028507 [Entomophthora muscae]
MWRAGYISSILYIGSQIGSSLALFPDQAGVNDWHLRFVGTPQQTIIYQVSSGEGDAPVDPLDKILPIVRTEKNYIAALKPTDGSIAWRRSPNSNETTLDIDTDQHVLWAISKLRSHHYIRLYHPIKGHLLWEFRLGIPKMIPSMQACPRSHNPFDNGRSAISLAWIYGENKGLDYISTRKLVTLSNGRLVVKYKVGVSKPVWLWEPSESSVMLSKVFTTNKGIYVAGVESKSMKVVTYLLNATDGKELERVVFDSLPSNPSSQFHVSLLNSVYTVFWGETSCGDSYAKLEYISAVSFRGASLKEAVHSQVKAEELYTERIEFIGGDSENTFHIQGISNSTVTHCSSFLFDGVILSLVSSTTVRDGVLGAFPKGSELYFVSSRAADKAKDHTLLGVTSQKHGLQETKLTLNQMQFGQVSSVSVAPLGSNMVVMMVTTEDLSMHMFSGGLNELQHVWTREESLAYADKYAILELPDSHLWTQADEPILDGLASQYFHRVCSNWATVSSFFTSSRLLSQRASDGIRVRDKLGFRKLLVFSTPGGKLMALDSLEKGAVVWSRFIGLPVVKLVLLRSALVKLPPVLGVVTHQEPHISFEGETRLMRIDGFTGLDFVSPHLPSEEVISGSRPEIMLLPLVDPSEATQVLAFIRGGSVKILPSFTNALSEMERLPQKVFGFSSNSSSIGGFHLIAQENSAIVQPTWQLGIPANQILAVIATTPRHSASRGRVLKDRRVLYKYLNPHLILVASYNQGLIVNLIDGISGSILHETVHPNALGDHFQAVVTENTVVYHFWDSSDSKSYVTVVLELFESQFPDVRAEASQDYPSFVRPLPYVSSRAFVSEGMASAIGVTVTRQGIANREFLFAITPGNHIVAIPSRILDAMRPYPNTPRLNSIESVLDYTPAIQLDPKAVLTYGQDVAGISNIVSSPTVYESTAVIFGFGLDVFWTSYAPSQQFDVLSPDFSKVALLSTVFVLVIGIFIAGPMLQEKKVQEQWL